MKIVVGSDHAGFPMKAEVLALLKETGHEVLDVGSFDPAPVDFPDIARKVAAAITSGQVERGLMVCGTGVGASIGANKMKGIRAAVCHDVHSAHQCVEHDDVNVMCIGAQIVGPWLAKDLISSLPRRYVLYRRRIPASRGQARGHGCRTLRNRTIREEAVLKKYAASMALAIAAVVAAMSLAHADALDDIKKAGKIRIAIDLGVPPYGMTDDKLQPTGLDVETAQLLAKDWGLEFEHVPTTGATRIPALQTGKADLVISSLSYTAERAKVIDFSLGYAVLRTVIAAPKSVALKSLADLDGKTVATVRGTTHDTQLTKDGPKGMKLVRYEDDATEAQAFLSGQVDIFSTAEMIVPQIDKKNPARQVELKFVLDNFKLAVGVKKDEKRLLDEVNVWIAANLKNGRLNELNKKYFGGDLPDLILKQ